MKSFVKHVINTGIRPEYPFEEQKKIRSLNVGGLIGAVLAVIYCALNIFTAHFLLALCYFLLLLLIQVIFLLQHYGLRRLVRFISIFAIIGFCGFIGLGYQNSTELLLLFNVAVIVLLLDSWWLIGVLALLDMFAFIFICIYNASHPPLIEPLPPSRNIISVISFFVLTGMALLYYKYEQQRYRERLEALNRQNEEKALRLENLNRAKEKVLSILSHDLRQPLTSMKSLLLLDEELSPDLFRDFAARARGSLDNVLLSLENTLRWSHTQLKGISTNPRYCSVYDILEQLREQFTLQLQEKQLSFNLSVARDTLAYADTDHLSIILRNLLSNAVKFTPREGSITAMAKAVNGEVEISMADTGVGIDVSLQQRLFDLERHFTRYGTENEHGTGLGLLVVKELTELNHGRIHLSSQAGKGTVFSILLPASAT